MKKYIKFIINNNNMKLITKIYIKFININNNKKLLNINIKFKYFELKLYNQIKISKIDKLLKIIN